MIKLLTFVDLLKFQSRFLNSRWN